MQKYKDVIDIIDKENKKAGNITGIPTISSKPAETPEKEIKRRRDIINSQFDQTKNMHVNLNHKSEKSQILEDTCQENCVCP